MIEELIFMHNQLMSHIPLTFTRYLYQKINWDAHGLCVVGDRGVGKTTLICQDLLRRYQMPDRALYLSADHINVISYGLVNIAKQFFSYGGEALYIDEVHKYPEWSQEIKNILDAYPSKQLIFSASSSIDLNRSKGDLSRRVVYHRLLGLSFREFLELSTHTAFSEYSIQDILKKHVSIASDLTAIPILKYYKNYLIHGYYPFFMEGIEDYLLKLLNVIEKVLFEDLAVVYNLRQTTLPILKKILWLVATSNGFIPNIDKLSRNLGVSREMVYNCLEYLSSSGLLIDLFASGKGNNLIRKPGKIYLNNANLLHAIMGSLKHVSDGGVERETFFVNQVSSMHKILLHEQADFIVDDKYIVEVGGKGKNNYQISEKKEAYLAIDDISVGFGNKIPLYLFGMLY